MWSAIISGLGCGDLWRDQVGVLVGEVGKEVGDLSHQNAVEGRFAEEVPGMKSDLPHVAGADGGKKVAATIRSSGKLLPPNEVSNCSITINK